jgi:hypothetical protein
MSTATPAPRTTPHFASLAAALRSGDRELLARTFGEMAEELMELAAETPTEELWMFVGRLHEAFYYEAAALHEPVKPAKRRRWGFRAVSA